MSKTSFACFLLCRIFSTLLFRSILTLFSCCSAAAELTWRFLEAAAIFLTLRSPDRRRSDITRSDSLAPPLPRRVNDNQLSYFPHRMFFLTVSHHDAFQIIFLFEWNPLHLSCLHLYAATVPISLCLAVNKNSPLPNQPSHIQTLGKQLQ